MLLLIRYLAEKKKPPHASRAEQVRHSGWYSFFQSLIDLTAQGQTADIDFRMTKFDSQLEIKAPPADQIGTG